MEGEAPGLPLSPGNGVVEAQLSQDAMSGAAGELALIILIPATLGDPVF